MAEVQRRRARPAGLASHPGALRRSHGGSDAAQVPEKNLRQVRTRLALRTAATLLLLPACRGGRPATDPVILALGDQQVRRSDFERYVAGLEARQEGPLEPQVREAVFEAYLERRVLVLEARSQGLLANGASAEQEQAAVEKLLTRAAGDRVQVTEDEIDRYYVQHQADLVAPETVTLRQILVATSNEARDVKRRLQKDPRRFEALAQTASRGPEAGSGGLMGVFARGQLPPELEEVAFALKPGDTSSIVETSLGYHVLHCDARESERKLSLDESRPRIRALLAAEKSEREQRALVAELLARAKVNHEAAKARAAEES